MDAGMVAQARRFNRIVTQRVGALSDRFLARDRSLGEARVLWEIGAKERDVRSLRTELELDSGYLSRLLRSLEASGLIKVDAKKSDKRVRIARLTRKGLAERAVLDRRSDELAALLLEPLSSKQRAQLVTAMAEVERLMTATMVEIGPIDPGHPQAQFCLNAYFTELDRRFDSGFDPARSIPADEHELRLPVGLFLVATLRAEPIGCGALKFHRDEPAEIKRMWVAESARGLGLGRRLLTELEEQAASHGARAARLETNKTLVEAISLYRSAGYVEVAAFNHEPYAHHWFEKEIAHRGAGPNPARGVQKKEPVKSRGASRPTR
jgi:DNA-binding MarR family transcriptional regulator/GNAT superfamily N-acetyltransferase